ncbi:TIGR03862 family flavoprotein [Cohaesibacter intestini]|uniref:TIGR03862 family flavoprotein n=1 Tax=Cohaesibacter intestini TaxID=2211145 RepID=UPI000DEB1469|nr:TIGR03862 family flavoprotein [Cohaesibacter intestini]
MTAHRKKQVAIIGAGAAGLMAADRLSSERPDLAITLYDAMPSPARKILMAGKSGLNISHQSGIDAPERFLARYGKAAGFMAPMLDRFGTAELITWMEGLGQTLFVGSSGRLFPSTMKASTLLRSLLTRLDGRGVALRARHRWSGWDNDGALLFATPQGQQAVRADATLLSLGGPSWPRLGTDGDFVDVLQARGLAMRAFRPANCGFDANWPEAFAEQWAGQPVKSVRLSFGDNEVAGDFIITRHGIEGGPVYGLSASLRDAIEQDGQATLLIDLRPNQSDDQLAAKMSRPRGKQSLSNHLRKTIHLQGLQAALVKALVDRETMQDPQKLARSLKALPLPLVRTRPMAEAISTAGGVALDALDASLMVRSQPGLFVAGEMLDWEAPTGGYLLTACLSQGRWAADGIASYLA